MNDWRRYLCGGLASCTAEIATFPIDLTKTRLQLQGQSIGSQAGTRYRGMMHALVRIPKEEGIRALYRGMAPAMLRQASYGTLKMGIYKDIRHTLTANFGAGLKIDIASAIVAGGVASAIANPTDVVKVRMQAQNSATKYRGVIDAFVKIFRTEGIGGLYKGVGPTVQRACIVAAVELPTYDATKRYLINNGHMKDDVSCHFLSSFIAGFCAAVASNPIDVVKTRLMNQSTASEQAYKGTIDCFKKTLAHEGWTALYKGFIPCYTRLGPWNMVFFMSYEQYSRLTGLVDLK